MDNEKYNGWHNYATWRIALEWFDCYELTEDEVVMDPADLAENFKDMVEHEIENAECSNSLIIDYALAFLSDVDWNEIAEKKINDYLFEYEWKIKDMDLKFLMKNKNKLIKEGTLPGNKAITDLIIKRRSELRVYNE